MAGQVKFLQAIRGKVLRETPVTTKIRLILFRNDEKKEFQIQIVLPQGHIYNLKVVAYHNKKIAIKEYEELLEKLKSSKKE
jgi:hypothetical protein